MSAWTARLHDYGYFSGFYSSMSSGIADQVANYSAAGLRPPGLRRLRPLGRGRHRHRPGHPGRRTGRRKRRMKQYRGDHKETWGGVTINIDNDYLDVAPLPPARFADFTGNGWSDVLARTPRTGALVDLPRQRHLAGPDAARTIGAGWNGDERDRPDRRPEPGRPRGRHRPGRRERRPVVLPRHRPPALGTRKQHRHRLAPPAGDHRDRRLRPGRLPRPAGGHDQQRKPVPLPGPVGRRPRRRGCWSAPAAGTR